MKILLVNPPRFKEIPVIREERCEITDRYSVLPPYSLMQIASILRNKGHEVDLVDANGFNLSFNELKERVRQIDYNALIFRFTPTTFDWDMEITKISKEINKNAATIGICFTLRTMAAEVMNEAGYLDYYIMHECEVVAPSLISALANGDITNAKGAAYRDEYGSVKINPPAEPISDYDSLPIPAYDLLPSLDPYYENTRHGTPFTIMYTSKGCPFACIFCTVAKTKWKARSAKGILDELRYLKENYNIKLVNFFDETFTIRRDRVIDIANAIRNEGLNISWYCNSKVDLVDEELLKIMKEGGCRGISYGIESGNQKILDNAKKNTTIKQAEKAIKMTKKVGIKAYCSFLFGLPEENWNTVRQTIDFVKRTLPTGAQFNVAVPYPGTELYNIALKKRWIGSMDFRNLYQHESVMRTDELSADDLNEARRMAYKALYSNPRWWMQNILHVVRNPEDFMLATRYVMKIMNNFFVRRMEHGH